MRKHKRIKEERISSRNPAGKGVEEPLDSVIEPTTEDDPSLDSEYMSHIRHHFEENRLRCIVRKTLIKERMESDIYKIVVRSLNRTGPMSHQELLGRVLGDFPMLSDEEIDSHIDSLADQDAILFDPKMQKYY